MQNRHKHKGNHANREDNVNPRIVFNNLKPGQILDQLITNHVGKRDDDDKELAVKPASVRYKRCAQTVSNSVSTILIIRRRIQKIP